MIFSLLFSLLEFFVLIVNLKKEHQKIFYIHLQKTEEEIETNYQNEKKSKKKNHANLKRLLKIAIPGK